MNVQNMLLMFHMHSLVCSWIVQLVLGTALMLEYLCDNIGLVLHAPQGYGTWSVCVSVCSCLSDSLCVRHHQSCHYAQLNVQPKVSTASAQSGKHFKYGVFSKNAQKLWREKANKLISMCLPRWHRWSDISPEIWVLSKSNGRLQATWHSKAASY